MQATQTVPQFPQSQSRRITTLDIETVSLDPADPKGALDAMFGRIVCIGLLFDDGQKLTPTAICEADEKRLLERFWASITDKDLLVGHNILEFDLMFIRQRSWILGVRPPLALNLKKYYTDQVVDVMTLWTNWSTRFKGATLDNIAWALGCGSDSDNGAAWSGNGHGVDVAAWWANGDHISIIKSCMSDVWRAYRVYCRLNFREPLGVPLPAFSSAPRPAYDELLQAVGTPARAPETRECVPVSASPTPAPGYAHMSAPEPRPEIQPTPRTSRRPRRQGNREIAYRAAGGTLVLTGATFPIHDTLKKVFSARGSKNGDSFQWELGASHFDALAGLCQKTGIRLVQTA
jgi:predicted 3'-5' exonuclease similar to PolB exonuclease domain